MPLSTALVEWNGVGGEQEFEDTCFRSGYEKAIDEATILMRNFKDQYPSIALVIEAFAQEISKLDDGEPYAGN